MLLIFPLAGGPADAIVRLTESAMPVQVNVMVAAPEDHTRAILDQRAPNLHVFKSDIPHGVVMMQTVIQAARHLSMSHILIMDPLCDVSRQDLTAIKAAIANDPDALIVGCASSGADTDNRLAYWRRRWGNFWYRMQTGRKLDHARSGIYIFSVDILDSLRMSSRPGIFRIQAPVRAAWAGIKIKQVDLADYQKQATDAITRPPSVCESILQALMTVHLTMRAITPLPHRKIDGTIDKPGRKVSIIHPLRSIKTLLTENATPWQLCLAAMMGVFLGALPLIAVHTIAILFAAGYFRLNKVAALAASQLCMPPIVPALCIEIGYYLRFGQFLTEISLRTLGYQAIERLYEWLLGSLLLGPLLAVLIGAAVYFIAVAIRRGLGSRSVSAHENDKQST